MSTRVTWGDGSYAGFWIRVAARLLDWLIVGVATGVIAVVVGFLLGVAALTAGTGGAGQTEPGATLVLVVWLALWLPDFLYDTIMTSRFGWTVGKRAVGIEVRHADGGRLSYGRAVGRYFGRWVAFVPLYLGVLWAAWDPRKQAWHDKFVNSFVVSSAATGPPAAAPVGVPAAARPWGGQSGWGIPGAARPDAGGRPGWGATSSPEGPATWGEGSGTDAAAAGAREETDWARELSWDTSPAGPPPSVTEPPSEGPHAESRPALDPSEAPLDPSEAPQPGWEQPAPGTDDPAHRPQESPGAGGGVREGEPRPAGGEPPASPQSPQGFAGQEEYSSAVPAAHGYAPADRRREASDPNVVAIGRSGVADETAAWLDQVADQVDSRLDRVADRWRGMPHAEAGRACAFGLLLGHLALLYPHMGEDLSRVAEAHPSYSTLGEGTRLATLQQIVSDPARAAAWLGPLVGAEDPEQVRRLLD